MGYQTLASGEYSTAMGDFTTAVGSYVTAMGNGTIANGNGSIAMGASTEADGTASVAMGYLTTASGNFSTAMGNYVTTNSFQGSFILGDNSSNAAATSCSAANQMMMRFAGGYKLYTNDNASIGVQVAAGGNSWSTISDRRKKENFAPVNGDELLKKISTFNLTSWNYIGQDPQTFRHYGPMAQDFFAAFGHDRYGTSGNDTTICQADMEGITFIAVQALEKKIEQLQKEITQKDAENSALKAEITVHNNQITDRLDALERELQKEKLSAK